MPFFQQPNKTSPRVLTAAEQTLILQTLICDEQEEELTSFETALLDRIKKTFQDIQSSSQSDQEKLSHTIRAVNLYLAKLEQCSQPSTLLRAYQAQDIYKMLYHKTNSWGVPDRSGLKPMLQNGYIGIGFSTLFLISFLIVSLTPTPAALAIIPTALFTAAFTYVSALIYGVTNDIFATRANLPYFLLGHQQGQHTLLKTNDPLAQGVAWGVAATFAPALFASIVFGVATLITAPFVPTATFLLPVMMLAMPLIAYRAERYAQNKAREYALAQIDLTQIGSNLYQSECLKQMCPTKTEKAAWLATSDRNLFGYLKMPLVGLGVLGALVTLSVLSPLLPAVLFSPMLSVIIPAATAGAGILTLSGLGLYAYANRDKQIDNRYKLAFTEETYQEEPALYLDDHPESLFSKILQSAHKKPTEKIPTEAPVHFKSPIHQPHRQTPSNTPNFEQTTSSCPAI